MSREHIAEYVCCEDVSCKYNRDYRCMCSPLHIDVDGKCNDYERGGFGRILEV